jgi:hypothetical protein
LGLGVIWVLRIFGFAVASIESYELVAEEEEDDDSPSFAGGSGHNFERDLNPISPDDRYARGTTSGFNAKGSR